jgi:aminopeptidase N
MRDVGDIIAIGGGGFGRNPNQPVIEKYIIEQSQVVMPNVCFIPTASAEDSAYTVNFYTAFSKLNCTPMHMSFFQRTPRLDSIINKQDIIYVGGGNTKSMLAVWREWKLDKLLLKAYKRGVILCGVSAGAICWFEKGVTDSWASNLNIMDCMGFVKGCCCPHYDGESHRKPSLEKFLMDSKIDSCFALDDGSALHYKNGKIHSAISFYKNAHAYEVSLKDGNVHHHTMKGVSLI